MKETIQKGHSLFRELKLEATEAYAVISYELAKSYCYLRQYK